MLKDTGFCPNVLDGDDLVGCILNQLNNAVGAFLEVMILLVVKTTTLKDKIAIPLDPPRENLSRSSHYASADSEMESDGSISNRRMSPRPS